MRTGIWLQRALVITMILACVLALVVSIAALWMAHAGYQAMVMRTNSMEPTIASGDIVIVRPIAPSELQSGDIITFTAPIGSSRLVTHRIVAIEEVGDGPAFVTRGDRNESADPWLFQYAEEGWILAYSVPWLGNVLNLPHSLAGRMLGVAFTFSTSLFLLWPVVKTGSSDPSTGFRTSPTIRPLVPSAARPMRPQSIPQLHPFNGRTVRPTAPLSNTGAS